MTSSQTKLFTSQFV